MKGKSESGRMTKGLHDSLFPATEGFAILSSCKLHEVSYEMPEKKHGVFSYFLVEGLQGAADFDSDGHIMVSDTSRYTAEKTMEWSYKEGVQQTPNLFYNVVGDLILVSVPRLENKKAQDKKIEKVEQDISDLALPISSIALFPPFDDNAEKRREWAEKFSDAFCPYLLRYFALHEITYTKNKYVFPLGKFEEAFNTLTLKYNLQELEKVEDILMKGASILQPGTFIYYCSSSFDIRRISKSLKKTKWKIIGYNPKVYEEKKGFEEPFLRVAVKLPELKQELRLRLYNLTEKHATSILIATPKEERLDEKSIQMLRPTKFFRLLGDIWKHK